MDQKNTQGQQKTGQDAPESGQQDWNERQAPNPNRDPAEGSRQTPGNDRDTERGSGSDFERNSERDTDDITNRDLDSDMDEQEDLPERGTDQSER